MGSESWPYLLGAAALGLALLVLATAFFVRRSRKPESRPETGKRPTQGARSESPHVPRIPPAPLSSADLSPAPVGDFAAGYRILRLIAEGGMGGVYEAEDLSLGRRVAIKRMRTELRVDGKEKQRFLEEARIVASLRHPNIVEIYTVAHQGAELYLVFEYVAGKSLHSIVKAKGRLGIGVCRNILRQVGAALDHAHSNRVLHRDLKPANIMVSLEGRIKVMDFGIARQARETLSRLSPAMVFGTLYYMAPEQHLGEEKRPSDLYALGVCLYEMLAGTVPFMGPDTLLFKEKLDFTPLSRHVPELGPKADEFMLKALDPDAKRRFQTASEFLKAFDEAFPASLTVK